MSSSINLSTVTFSGKEIMSLKEAFYAAVFANPTIEQFHTIVNGIKAKQQIISLGQFGLLGKKLVDCDVTPSDAKIPTTEKFWDPEYIGDRLEECYSDLLDTFFVWGLKNGVHKPDLTNTDFANFLEERLSLASYETALRFAWLGNKAADNVANGGYLRAGVDPQYFNSLNGFWVQALAIVAANSAHRVAIAKNTGNSYTNQAFTADDTTNKVATGIFESMIYNADFRLRGAKDGIIVTTQSLVDQYARERKAYSNIDLAYERQENGIDTFKIDGIEIIPFQFLDRHIRSYEDNGTKWNNPHRAIYTTKNNLQIGTEETSNFTELDPFYDKKSKKYIVDFAFNLDAKIVEDHMITVAY